MMTWSQQNDIKQQFRISYKSTTKGFIMQNKYERSIYWLLVSLIRAIIKSDWNWNLFRSSTSISAFRLCSSFRPCVSCSIYWAFCGHFNNMPRWDGHVEAYARRVSASDDFFCCLSQKNNLIFILSRSLITMVRVVDAARTCVDVALFVRTFRICVARYFARPPIKVWQSIFGWFNCLF